ncbi:hypothetical protein SLEP1_g57787 [Rubroshorea leprosula]|uniref:Uncharacterized protein n=1 Tax=Rubroshorea leprosula TaxID=152421 RepID=A0AAV5MM75_9ROSI|nr:hypothetical protein SLEP1_g57787 [Rubroshorea leprosula]
MRDGSSDFNFSDPESYFGADVKNSAGDNFKGDLLWHWCSSRWETHPPFSVKVLMRCNAPEPESEARQTPCTRETGPTDAQGSELTEQNHF